MRFTRIRVERHLLDLDVAAIADERHAKRVQVVDELRRAALVELLRRVARGLPLIATNHLQGVRGVLDGVGQVGRDGVVVVDGGLDVFEQRDFAGVVLERHERHAARSNYRPVPPSSTNRFQSQIPNAPPHSKPKSTAEAVVVYIDIP